MEAPSTPTSTRRLFFALWPDEALRAQLAERADALIRHRGIIGHPSRPQRYHLTLNFLGDAVPAAVETSVRRAATRIQAPPFTLRLDKAGSFNNKDIPVWFGCQEPPLELRHLDQRLRSALRGLPVDKNPGLKPHLTILRGAEKRLRDETIVPIEWQVQEFVLIDSYLDETPVRYEILERYPLRGGPLQPEPVQFSLLP